jgi:glycine/D-amino acid oxidase-like deaminating enzyme
VASEQFDVVIVGAGIVGAACALELAAAGLLVCVVERDVVGSGATAAGMGHIVVMDEGEAQLALTHYSQRLWDALVAEAPEGQHEYLRCGTIWVAADAEEMDAVAQKHTVYADHDIRSTILDANALYACEPNLRPGLAGGLLVPGDSVVYPPRSAAVLLDRARAFGTKLMIGQVAELVPGGVLLETGTVVQAAAVVLANGSRVVELASDVPVRPKKGHLAITDRYPGFVRHQLVELGYIKNAHATSGDSVAFNVQPRGSGQILLGSSRQFDDQSSDVDHAILSRMILRAQEYLPGIARLHTPDGLPLIGPHPVRAGVWLATGHEGFGITTSLGTAKLLAAQMLGRDAPIATTPYLPSRPSLGHAHG